MNWSIFTKKENWTRHNPVFSDVNKVVTVIKKIIPLLILATFLPIFYGFLINPPSFNYSSQAEQIPELDIWLEPANVLTTIDKNVEFTVFARFDNNSKVIPGLEMELSTSPYLLLDKSKLSTFTSFSGKTTLGKVIVKATQNGEYQLSIPENSVSLIGPSIGTIKLNTAPASMVVR
jgi:hypothetical protein